MKATADKLSEHRSGVPRGNCGSLIIDELQKNGLVTTVPGITRKESRLFPQPFLRSQPLPLQRKL